MIKIGQSSIERLLYVILLLTFVITGVFYFQARYIINELKASQAQEQRGIVILQKQNYCFVSFFLQPNRTELTIAGLKSCQPVIKNQ